MCGICGIINFNKEPVKECDIKSMMSEIKHRGPNDEGVLINANIGLGFVRLSIIDLSNDGHQPMSSADDRYHIILNGEIYNYLEIKEELVHKYSFESNTDTEVVLNSFIEWGENCVNKFNGMWAFTIYDKKENRLFISRDRYGIKPFYYYKDENIFIFASEIKAILNILPNERIPNEQAIFDYLVYNRTDYGETTFFKNIKRLKAGHNIIVSDDKLVFRKWYDLRKRVNQTIGFDSSKEFFSLFEDSIKLRLRSDVPVGVCLSGGLDSSSIVSVLLKSFDMKQVNTFSAIYNKGQTGDETFFINQFKDQLENMHYITPNAESFLKDVINIVNLHGEPFPGLGPFAQFKVMELASKEVTVTLDGQGADEQLAGYHYFYGHYFKDLLRKGQISRLIKEMYYYFQEHKSFYGMKSFIFLMLPNKIKLKARTVNHYLETGFSEKHSSVSTIPQMLYSAKTLNEALMDHFDHKLEHLLKWDDRNSMFFSIESRVPFLDYRLVEKTLATSNDFKIRNGETKFILRDAMKGILPDKIQKRKDKIGFGSPSDEWFRTEEWKSFIMDTINQDSFKERGIVNHKKISDLCEKHFNNEINASKEIWKAINLELWFKQFIDNK